MSMLLIAAALPFVLYFVNAAMSSEKSSWSLEPIRESVASGRFLSDPGAAIFQQPLLISSTSSDSHIVETFASYVVVVLMTLAGILLVVSMLRLAIGLFFKKDDRLRQRTKLQSAAPMTEKVLKAMKISLGEELQKSSDYSWVVASAGRSIIVQTTVSTPLAPLLITSANHSLEAREKIILPKNKLNEVVSGATAHAHFHSYVPQYGQTSYASNQQVAALLIKHLDGTGIFIENRSVVAVFDSATIRSDVDFDRYIDALENVIRELQKNRSTGGELPLPKKRKLSRENIPVLAVLIIIAMYGVVTFFIPAGPTVSDLMVVATGMGWVYVGYLWRALSRRRNFMLSEWREV